jgi:hypothetical protein
MRDLSRLESWRADPAAFIERYLVHPETGRPYRLLPAERMFLQHALRFDDDGRMLFPLLVYGAPKKSGKSEFGAILTLVLTLLFGGRNAESFSVANDLEQSMARVFDRCCRICEVFASARRRREDHGERDRVPWNGRENQGPRLGVQISGRKCAVYRYVRRTLGLHFRA